MIQIVEVVLYQHLCSSTYSKEMPPKQKIVREYL